MRRILLLIIALGFLGGCLSPPQLPREAGLTPQEEKGWRVFQREPCFSACHVTTIASTRPDASTGFVPDLRKTPPRTRDWYLAYFVNPRAVLPSSPMPSFAYLSKAEVDALVALLQRLNKEVGTPPPQPAAPEEIPKVPKDLMAYHGGSGVYRTYCAGCHGEAGNGGGSVGHLLSPEPRDFTDAVWMSKQADTYLFSVISNGKPNTAMPAFRDLLSPWQRALALRYVEYFADPVAKERMELGFVLR